MAEEIKPASDHLARPPSPQRHSVAEVLAKPHRCTQMDGIVRRRQQSYGHASGFMDIGAPRDGDMMGPLLRRKKVVSLPLLGSQGNDFFFGDAPRSRQDHHTSASKKPDGKPHEREDSWPPGQHIPERKKANSFMDNLIRRKQVALDLYAPPCSQAAFFSVEAAKTEPSGEEETERPVLIKKFKKKSRCRLLPRFTKKSIVLPSENNKV
jgi:hypothetical protein